MRENDTEFRELSIKSVDDQKAGGWSITTDDGWSFFVPPDSPVPPAVGMTARFYGQGVGYAVRGLLLDGQEVFYRSAEDYKVHALEEQYGKDCAALLERWDSGRGIWSVEMGGLGPGYEQAIQITFIELLRIMVERAFDADRWINKEVWDKERELISSLAMPKLDGLGLSGAQFGAALSLAAVIYRRGPVDALTDEAVKERKIQVSKNFPSLAA